MEKLTYKASGVDVEAGEESVQDIKKLAAATKIKGVLGGIGHFGAFFKPDIKWMEDPVIVSSTDGVGTKLKLAFALDSHDTVGIDLVAMSVNDLICCGAKPLFFLDYVAIQKLEPVRVAAIVKGIADGCKQADCALIGGETAEMTDMYAAGEYDLAGFAVGIVDKPKIIDGSKIKAGDVLVGLASSGIHSNGYTLARKALDESFYKEMLVPTRIYAKEVMAVLKKKVAVHGIAHITGGGMPLKLGRIIPDGLQAEVDTSTWEPLPIFKAIQERGNVEKQEMFRTFNMGIGLIFVVPEKEAKKIPDGIVIGKIVKGKDKVVIV